MANNDDYSYLIEAENSFNEASKALRNAWRILKHHGMEHVAKELADTVLDVETSAQQLKNVLIDLKPRE